jgi:hypothetical protein
VIQETLALATKDFDGEYQVFQRIVNLATLMGDYMARGIMASTAVPASPQGA